MACAFFVLLLVVFLILGGPGAIFWFAGRKIIEHLRQNPEAVKSLAEHVVAPLLKEEKPNAEESVV
jgi:uncharacterized protein YneF (UPF0154 family)